MNGAYHGSQKNDICWADPFDYRVVAYAKIQPYLDLCQSHLLAV